MSKNKDLSVDEAWEKLLEKYDIVKKIEEDGIFHIEASQIKEFKEPRLMSKWDSSEQLPSALKRNKINILPNSRRSYVLGDFLLTADAASAVSQAIDAGLPADLIAQDLRATIHYLSSITGEITPTEVLSTIFSRFCIGK